MFLRLLSMALALLAAFPPEAKADEEGIPLSGTVKDQMDAITAAFADMLALPDLNRKNDLIGDIRFFSMPPLPSGKLPQNSLHGLHGMPGLIYQAIGRIDESNEWGVVLSGGIAAIRGLVMENFTYRQYSLGSSLLMGHIFNEVTLLVGAGYQFTRGEVAGSFLVADEKSRITYATAMPQARVVALLRHFPLQCEWVIASPRSETSLRLGERGALFYDDDATPWGGGFSQVGVILPWGGGAVGLGYIHDARHGDYYRWGLQIPLFSPKKKEIL